LFWTLFFSKDTLWQACNAIEKPAMLLSPFTPVIASNLLATLGVAQRLSLKALYTDQTGFSLLATLEIFP
jgi:methionyl-tRNA synthetase